MTLEFKTQEVKIVQLCPTSSGPKYEAARPRDATTRWYIEEGALHMNVLISQKEILSYNYAG